MKSKILVPVILATAVMTVYVVAQGLVNPSISAVGGSGGSSGVSSIVAGTGITISPVGGTGAVTINSSGGAVNYITNLNGFGTNTKFFATTTNASVHINPLFYAGDGTLAGTAGGSIFTITSGTTAGWVNGFNIVGLPGEQYRVDDIIDATHFRVHQRIVTTYTAQSYTIYGVGLLSDDIQGPGHPQMTIENDGSIGFNTQYARTPNSGGFYFNALTNTMVLNFQGDSLGQPCFALSSQSVSVPGSTFGGVPFTVSVYAPSHALDILSNGSLSIGIGETNLGNLGVGGTVTATGNISTAGTINIGSGATTFALFQSQDNQGDGAWTATINDSVLSVNVQKRNGPQAVMTANTTSTATFNTSANTETIYNTSGTTISGLTITLPATTSVGETLRYVTAAVDTSVTVSGTVSVGAALTSLAANGTVAWQAVNTTGTFIRIQ